MVPTWELTFVLGYLGKSSLDLRTRVRRTIERDLPYCKLKVIFRSKCRLNTLVQFKDSLEKKIRSGITYRYMCGNCRVIYREKTFCHFHTRATQHMGTSTLTGKRLKNVKQYAISDHLFKLDCVINFDDLDVLVDKFKLYYLLRLRFERYYSPMMGEVSLET